MEGTQWWTAGAERWVGIFSVAVQKVQKQVGTLCCFVISFDHDQIIFG